MKVPSYVILIFIGLVYLGIKRCYPRVIKLDRLFLTPFIFTLLSLKGMFSLFNVEIHSFKWWIVGCLVGGLLGYIHVNNRSIKADHTKRLIQLPGDWSMLVLILAIFGFEFFIHYSIDSQQAWSSTLFFKYASITILGVIAGMSIGRTLNYFSKYQSTVSQDLVLSD